MSPSTDNQSAVDLSTEYYEKITDYFAELKPFEHLFFNFNSAAVELNAETNIRLCSKVVTGRVESFSVRPNFCKFLKALARDLVKVTFFKLMKQSKYALNSINSKIVVTYVDKRTGTLDQKDFTEIQKEINDSYQLIGIRLPTISLRHYAQENSEIYKIEKDFSYIKLVSYYLQSAKLLMVLQRTPKLNKLAGLVICDDIYSGHGHFGFQVGYALKAFVEKRNHTKTIIFPFENQDWILFSCFLQKDKKTHIEFWQNGLRAFGSLSLYMIPTPFAYRGYSPDVIRVNDDDWRLFFQKLGYKCTIKTLKSARLLDEELVFKFDKRSPTVLVIAGISEVEFSKLINYAAEDFGEENVRVRFHPSHDTQTRKKFGRFELKNQNEPIQYIICGNTSLRFRISFPADKFIKYHVKGEIYMDPWISVNINDTSQIRFKEK